MIQDLNLKSTGHRDGYLEKFLEQLSEKVVPLDHNDDPESTAGTSFDAERINTGVLVIDIAANKMPKIFLFRIWDAYCTGRNLMGSYWGKGLERA